MEPATPELQSKDSTIQKIHIKYKFNIINFSSLAGNLNAFKIVRERKLDDFLKFNSL